MGRAIAIELASKGWATVLIARRSDSISALASELSQRAPSVPLCLDLCHTAAIGPGVAAFLGEHAIEPDALFNNAGFGIYAPFERQSAADHEALWRVNYLGAVEMTRALLPVMLQRRRGHVINIASMSTKVGPWGHAGYSASKCALVSVTEVLACEHPAAKTGVHFSVVNPGIVATPYFEADSFRPLWPRVKHRVIPPERVARAAVRLLTRPRAEICVPWFYRTIQWINALSPSLARRIVAAESRPAE